MAGRFGSRLLEGGRWLTVTDDVHGAGRTVGGIE